MSMALYVHNITFNEKCEKSFVDNQIFPSSSFVDIFCGKLRKNERDNDVFQIQELFRILCQSKKKRKNAIRILNFSL